MAYYMNLHMLWCRECVYIETGDPAVTVLSLFNCITTAFKSPSVFEYETKNLLLPKSTNWADEIASDKIVPEATVEKDVPEYCEIV